jgi:hypothetical protein
MSWAIKLHTTNRIFIRINYSFNTVTFRLKNIAVKGETVFSSILPWWDGSSEPQSWNLLFMIIVLKDVSNTFNCVKILIFI